MPGIPELAAVTTAVLDSKELLLEIYKDLAQPGVKQVGNAVGTVLGLGNTLLLPLRLLNERASSAFSSNMEKYREKLKEVPLEEIQQVSPEIGIPILERMTYVSDEAISEMFVQLLANASQVQHADEAHPAFVHVIDNMSPDEARLIKVLNPLLVNSYGMYQISPPGSNRVISQRQFLFHPAILEKANLSNPEYIGPYMENLTRLGIFMAAVYSTSWDYTMLEPEIQAAHAHLVNGELLSDMPGAVHWNYGLVRYTEFGYFFRNSCRLGIQ